MDTIGALVVIGALLLIFVFYFITSLAVKRACNIAYYRVLKQHREEMSQDDAQDLSYLLADWDCIYCEKGPGGWPRSRDSKATADLKFEPRGALEGTCMEELNSYKAAGSYNLFGEPLVAWQVDYPWGGLEAIGSIRCTRHPPAASITGHFVTRFGTEGSVKLRQTSRTSGVNLQLVESQEGPNGKATIVGKTTPKPLEKFRNPNRLELAFAGCAEAMVISKLSVASLRRCSSLRKHRRAILPHGSVPPLLQLTGKQRPLPGHMNLGADNDSDGDSSGSSQQVRDSYDEYVKVKHDAVPEVVAIGRATRASRSKRGATSSRSQASQATQVQDESEITGPSSRSKRGATSSRSQASQATQVQDESEITAFMPSRAPPLKAPRKDKARASNRVRESGAQTSARSSTSASRPKSLRITHPPAHHQRPAPSDTSEINSATLGVEGDAATVTDIKAMPATEIFGRPSSEAGPVDNRPSSAIIRNDNLSAVSGPADRPSANARNGRLSAAPKRPRARTGPDKARTDSSSQSNIREANDRVESHRFVESRTENASGVAPLKKRRSKVPADQATIAPLAGSIVEPHRYAASFPSDTAVSTASAIESNRVPQGHPDDAASLARRPRQAVHSF